MFRALLCLAAFILLGFSLSCNNEPAVAPSQTPDPPAPVHLSTVLPSEVGTQWNYTYSTYSNPNSTPVWGGYVYDTHAAFRWTIASADSVSDSLVCQINVTGQDTIRNTHYEYGVIVSDTVYITQVQSQWRMIFYRDEVLLDWYSSINPMYPFTHTVPKSSIETTDTLMIGGYITGGTESFVRGVGLVGFTGGHANQTTWSKQELKLTSWSPPLFQSVPEGAW